jgi:hypothetical protein
MGKRIRLGTALGRHAPTLSDKSLSQEGQSGNCTFRQTTRKLGFV